MLVWALQEHLLGTSEYTPALQQLCASCTRPRKSVAVNALAYWLRRGIRDSHLGFSPEDLLLTKINAHEVTSVATSLDLVRIGV